MIYCINPLCEQRQNPDNVERCLCCGTSLLINDRIRLLKPLRELTENPFTRNEIFEVDDAGTKWNPVRKRRVMKVMKWNSPELVQLIERESLALQLIQHPNTPESNTLDDLFSFVPNNSSLTLHCLVMDKFDGQNLEEWIKENEPISQSLALEWLRQLVEIIDIVHHTEFFHRDIKPANIILQPSGQLALIDFGTARRITDTYLAKVSGSGGTQTTLGNYEITSVVSHYYTPLEQVHGKAVPQSDFYALGRTFVRLVTGTPLMRLPIDQKTGNLVWRNKAQQIDKPLADFLDELMAPVPGQRPATTEVILQRLKILPRQSKVYKITRSKTFIFGVIIASAGLIGLGIDKIGLPAYANNLVAEGQKLEAGNNSEQAQSYFDKAVRVRPQLSFEISQFYFDKAARNLTNPQIAKKYYELAIKYNEQDVSAYNNLAAMCQQLQDDKCVEDSYEKLLKLNPNSWEGNYGLGYFYDTHSKYDFAQEQYELAIKNSGQAIHAVAALARLKNKNGDYKMAAALAIKGLEKTQNPELQASLYKDLGWSSLMQNKLGEAEKYLEKATELDPQRTDAYCLLAQVEEANGQIDNARISVEVCMLAKSSLPEVFEWRQKLLERILKK
ncbi:MAG: protein kinase domain-containing protein [Nostoc sp. EkiNYC01]|nr:tetratricopeptide repeat protein [Nostoc sp. EkiNYC01]